jgi:hypothetical protein
MTEAGPRPGLDRRWLAALLLLGVATRVVWAVLVHPPADHVRSDMSAYVYQALDLAQRGAVLPARLPAFRPFGTGWLLGALLWVFGPEARVPAAVVQAVVAGLGPALAALLTARAVSARRAAPLVGLAVLVWFPGLSLSGYFLSEPWYTTLLLASLWLLVRAVQGASGAAWGGLLAGVAFWVRPEVAVVYGLAAGVLLVARAGTPGRALGFALPLVAAIGFGVVRHHHHTGRWGGVADTAALNLTMGRCHLVRLEAYATAARKRTADAGGDKEGWWIDLPGYRQLRARREASHPLGLRPSLSSWRASYVGAIDDPEALGTLRRRCLASDTVAEQARKSVVNAHLLWAFSTPWPEVDQDQGALRALAQGHLWAAAVVWLVALPGGLLALVRARRRPEAAVVAVAALGIVLVSAVFFGTPRLRTPYDPLAFVLVAGGAAALLDRVRSSTGFSRGRA